MFWFRLACVVPQICVEASISYLRSVWGSRWEESASHHVKTPRKAKKPSKLEIAFCAPASYRGQLLCQFHVFIFHQVLKLEPIQNHCSWWPEPSGTFQDWFWSTLGIFIFHHVWHVWGHFQKYFEKVPKQYSLVLLQNWCVTNFNVFKTWGLSRNVILINFSCPGSD
jgi:hypothetical protein